MHDPAMALPAVPGAVEQSRYHLIVTADAVFPYRVLSVVCYGYRIRIYPSVKKYNVFHSIQTFPEEVVEVVVIGEVTINAFNRPVQSGQEPGLVLVFHDVAAVAERGS